MPANDSKHILLVYLPMTDPGYIMADRTEYSMKRVPLLGLQYLVAVLREQGYQPRLIDGSIESITAEGLEALQKQHPLLFMGFYIHHYTKSIVCRMLQTMHQRCPNLPLVVGGPGFFDYESYLDAGARIVCHGEGETTIVEIARYLRGECSLAEVRGISYRSEGKTCVAPPQPLITDLDSLPFPDRSTYPIECYYDYHVVGMRKPYTTMITSRGCPHHCAFCTTHDIWGAIRRRSVANVMAEIDFLVARFKIRYIGFKDDLFGSQKQWVESFIDELGKRRYDLRFNCMVSPNSFNWDPEGTLQRLRDVGLDMIIPGLQSANGHILKKIGRSNKDPYRLFRLVKAAKALEITTVVEFILGLPGETEETVETNLRFALTIRPHYALFFSLVVLEGSQIACQSLGKPITSLPGKAIDALVTSCSHRYFGNPYVLMQFVTHVLKKNPRWFIDIIPHIGYLGRAVGFKKKRKQQ